MDHLLSMRSDCIYIAITTITGRYNRYPSCGQ